MLFAVKPLDTKSVTFVTFVCVLAHFLFAILPKLYVISISGIMSLLTSPLSIKLSSFASPIIIFPLAVILPVACKLPVTLVSVLSSIVPVPFVSNDNGASLT